jgi:hypothetical protein
MYITAVPNRGSKPCLLLRESYREGGKVKNRTLANVTHWPPSVIEALRCAVRGEAAGSAAAATTSAVTADSIEVLRSLPHGAVAAVHGTMRKLSLAKLLGPKGRERDLCLAMIAARVVEPRSKLATAQGLDPETIDSTLAEVLGVEGATEDELYGALDWLIERQERIEDGLAKRHLAEGATLLYDLTSTYMEGRTCPLAERGYSRDRRSERL